MVHDDRRDRVGGEVEPEGGGARVLGVALPSRNAQYTTRVRRNARRQSSKWTTQGRTWVAVKLRCLT